MGTSGNLLALERAGRALGCSSPGPKRHALPRLWFVTDLDRTPDPAAIAAHLPRGTGVIFRGFGRSDAPFKAMALARIARARGLILLIGLDEALAAQVGADGVHLPERALGQARRIRMRHPRWLITGAAHSLRAARRAKGRGLDAALVSPVFASRSPSAGRPLGVMRFSAIARRAGLPVIALGGVNARTARRLADTGAWGLAAVDVFAPLAGRQGAA